MSSSHPHVVATPFFLLPLRAVQAVLAIILLGLFAYSIDAYNDLTGGFDFGHDYILGGFGVGLWSTLLTLILIAYFIVTPRFLPVVYNIFVVFALEALALLFWLVTWALVAKTVSWRNDNDNLGGGGGGGSVSPSDLPDGFDDCILTNTCSKKRSLATRALHSFAKRGVNYDTFTNVVYTSLALSLIIWLTFIVSFAFILLSFLKHRREGGPLVAGRSGHAAAPVAAPGAEPKDIEAQPMPATTAAPVQQQQPVLHQEPVEPAAPMH